MAEDKFEVLKDGLHRFSEEGGVPELFADDFVWDFSEFRGWIEDQQYHGIEGFETQMARWTEAFDSWAFEIDQMLDAGGDDVLGLGVQRAVLKDSGAEVEMPFAQIWTVRDGLLAKIRIFATHEDGYAAAGIEPPA